MRHRRRETYDQLWLSWNQALASPDARRYAFTVLRGAGMSATPHIDDACFSNSQEVSWSGPCLGMALSLQ
ncbi:hypothetical protein [Streptomyces sp. NBC_01171]|uniref:hypothetical protein n=1 Tax=Streptomyces sp. NBC_01171 TaxID=2903757 RepID=UPI00386A4802|nr:hypothetical protein OG448_29980 [Streptomyces sp. NBC_01171]